MIMMTCMLTYWALCGATDAGVPMIRVMTYNIRHGEGIDHKVDLDRIAGVIRAANPDVVCLQEVDRNLPRTNHMDQPALLADKLSMIVFFASNYPHDGGDYGTATLTRLPVVDHANLPLPRREGCEPRGCLRTTVQVGGQSVDILNTHLGLRPEERKAQAEAVAASVRDTPTVLAGDMNEERGQATWTTLSGKFRDTGAKEPTFPADRPRIKIDFVFVSQGWDVLSSRVFSAPEAAVASDHLPFVADLCMAAPKDTDADEGVHDNDDKRITDAIK